ncbi:MAG: GTP-binding protein, partial [Chloroflexota bacterium]|nr:GTP-binding protein [Chloroflexota bacterium]
FRRKARVPYMVVANKQDGRKALSVQKVGGALKLDSGIPVLPCIATDEESACKVLEGLKPLVGL